jgi:hypothetical protein
LGNSRYFDHTGQKQIPQEAIAHRHRFINSKFLLIHCFSVSEDPSIARTVENEKNQSKDRTVEEQVDQSTLPFAAEDFSKNELGF